MHNIRHGLSTGIETVHANILLSLSLKAPREIRYFESVDDAPCWLQH